MCIRDSVQVHPSPSLARAEAAKSRQTDTAAWRRLGHEESCVVPSRCVGGLEIVTARAQCLLTARHYLEHSGFINLEPSHAL